MPKIGLPCPEASRAGRRNEKCLGMQIQEWLRKIWIFPGLLHGEKAFHGPYYVNVDTTHRCNMRCLCCRWHSPLVTNSLLDPNAPKDIDAEIFERFCQSLEKMGSHFVLFVGAGEPALHPHFLKLVESTRRHKLRLIVYTNGTLFRNYSSQDLINSGLNLIRFSLSDISADIYAEKNPYLEPGTYEANWAALQELASIRRHLHKKNPKIELCIPIDRENMMSLDKLVDRGIAAGIDRVHFSVITDFNQENLKSFVLDPEEIKAASEQLEKIRRSLNGISMGHNIDAVLLRYRIGRSVLKRVPCYTAWFYSFVDTGGKVKVCQRTTEAFGDLREQTFSQIWNGPEYRAFRRRTLDQRDPEAARQHFDCSYCPHLANNYRVDRIFQWLSPLSHGKKPTAS
jgi:MoaA/NifB/PqqE/SkfB family radical SAM enzyme